MPGEPLALHNFGNIGRIIGVSAIEEIDHAGDLQTSECDRGSGGHGIGEHLLCTRDEEAWDQLAHLVSNGENRSIEFSDGPDNCVAVHKAGPPWQGGHVYMLHTSICRTDTAPARSEDVGYALGSVKIRQYDPVGNLRKAGE